MQGERRLRHAVDVAPQGGVGIEPVVRQQAPTPIGNQLDCPDDEFEGLFRYEVVEVEANPSRLDSLTSVDHLLFDQV